MTVRVAIVGASGIGRHHARWWQVEGAQVAAFVGSSETRVAATAEKLATHLGAPVPGYADMTRMLQEVQPDIVDICSPPPLHAEHVTLALKAGCDVLCEKPFVYDPVTPSAELLDEAQRLMAMAAEAGLRLCVCTQYAVGTAVLLDAYRKTAGDAPITRFHGQLEAPAKGRPADPQRIWVDLAPHLLSVILAIYPELRLDNERLAVDFAGYRASVTAKLNTRIGDVTCRLETANRTEAPNNIRRFVFNEVTIDVEGQQAADGEFGMLLRTPEHTLESEDMMRLLIRRFIAGELPVPPKQCLRNLELMLCLLDRNRLHANT